MSKELNEEFFLNAEEVFEQESWSKVEDEALASKHEKNQIVDSFEVDDDFDGEEALRELEEEAADAELTIIKITEGTYEKLDLLLRGKYISKEQSGVAARIQQIRRVGEADATTLVQSFLEELDQHPEKVFPWHAVLRNNPPGIARSFDPERDPEAQVIWGFLKDLLAKTIEIVQGAQRGDILEKLAAQALLMTTHRWNLDEEMRRFHELFATAEEYITKAYINGILAGQDYFYHLKLHDEGEYEALLIRNPEVSVPYLKLILGESPSEFSSEEKAIHFYLEKGLISMEDLFAAMLKNPNDILDVYENFFHLGLEKKLHKLFLPALLAVATNEPNFYIMNAPGFGSGKGQEFVLWYFHQLIADEEKDLARELIMKIPFYTSAHVNAFALFPEIRDEILTRLSALDRMEEFASDIANRYMDYSETRRYVFNRQKIDFVGSEKDLDDLLAGIHELILENL